MNKAATQLPTVSVLMPAYNAEAYLAEAIASILAQTFTDFELIVVDDGSTDRTSEILRHYAQADSRVRPLANAVNLGISRTRNRCLAEARGRYFAMLDSDDVALPGRLTAQVEFLNRNPDHALVGGQIGIIDEASRVTGRRIYPCDDAAIRKVLLRSNPFAHSACLLRKSALDHIGNYDASLALCEDYDLILRLARTSKVANLDQVVINYRISATQTKSTQLKRTISSTLAVQQRALHGGWHDSMGNKVSRLGLRALLCLPDKAVASLFRMVCYRRAEG